MYLHQGTCSYAHSLLQVCLPGGGEIRGIFDNAKKEKGYATANDKNYMENPRCRVSSGKVTGSVFCLIERTICVSKDKSSHFPRQGISTGLKVSTG